MQQTSAEHLCSMDATHLARLIHSGALSSREVTLAHLARIEACNGVLNALVTIDVEGALRQADSADRLQKRGGTLGALHGLPVAHKDCFATANMRTTWGSKVYADYIPNYDALIVKRQAQAGAILIGKTNMPEFGAGSQTFNEVFGATVNPYNHSLTCGGSSGGAAVALATGMVALADGSDMGGSLRNPASFCNIVGLRPSIGRIPNVPNPNCFGQLTVLGPMGRCVADVALLFSVIAGSDSADPLSIDLPAHWGASLPERDFKAVRVAYSPTLGGLPVADDVRAIIDSGAKRLSQLGIIVDEDEPDFDQASHAFQVLRALTYASNYEQLVEAHGDQLKDTVLWNIALAKTFSSTDVIIAEQTRARLFRAMQTLLETYDFLIAPVSQVVPFSIDEPYVTQIGSVPMDTYIDWMNSCSFITLTGHPAISVPCGFTSEGLPVGLQIIGRYRDELGLLQFAQAFEAISKSATAGGLLERYSALPSE